MIKVLYKKKNSFCTSYEIAVPNCYNQHDNEADMFFVRKSGFCDEVEIKLTRSDLMLDRKKTVRFRGAKYPEDFVDVNIKPYMKNKFDALLAGNMNTNYFWYLLKDDIGTIADIPTFAGLAIIDKFGELSVVRMPTRLHNRKLSFEARYLIAKKISYRFWRSEYGISEFD